MTRPTVADLQATMGSGRGCDAQYLFSTDILGTNEGHVPRHARRYGSIGQELTRIQALRVDAFRTYSDDVKAGKFPASGELVPIPEEELAAFRAALDD